MRSGEQRAVVVAVGGGIREYDVAGVPLLDGYAAADIADGGRGQLLVPWPNRIRDGRYDWQGRELQLSLTEPEKGHAIHGLARWMPWETVSASPEQVAMRLDLPPQPGYPFELSLEVTYSLGGEGLRVEQRATNVGSSPCPYASGCHPYLCCGAARADDLELTLPAGTTLQLDERSIPVGRRAVGGELDFRSARRIGGTVLDTAFTDLQRDAGGVCTVRVAGPALAADLWVDHAHTSLMVFTGDTLAPDRRRRGLAVEPMTAEPDAFNSGAGLQVLEPGETFVATWGIRPAL